MKYTFQTWSESGSFSCPEGNDVGHASAFYQLESALADWADTHSRVGSDERDASLLVWIGELADVTDQYPDFELIIGPRGGVRKVLC